MTTVEANKLLKLLPVVECQSTYQLLQKIHQSFCKPTLPTRRKRCERRTAILAANFPICFEFPKETKPTRRRSQPGVNRMLFRQILSRHFARWQVATQLSICSSAVFQIWILTSNWYFWQLNETHGVAETLLTVTIGKISYTLGAFKMRYFFKEFYNLFLVAIFYWDLVWAWNDSLL